MKVNHKQSIVVSHLTKTFTFPVKNPAHGMFRNLFFPERRTVRAVDDISFEVQQGERVAFIGPNGAGKSTTIKMLCGILFPSKGDIAVLGLNPTTDRKQLAYHVGTLFGQRSQLFPNLPLIDSLRFFGVMYDMTNQAIAARIKELLLLFEMEVFQDQPVRKLSLGQRMRAEIACALMHRPKIVFLDEPTIGLDVVAKKSLRDLLLTINKQEQTTIFLTSHDVGDIETLCTRTIVINHGKLVKDLPTAELSRHFVQEKRITLVPRDVISVFPTLPKGLSYVAQQPLNIVVSVQLQHITVQAAIQELLQRYVVDDIDVYDVELESIIRHIYESAAPQ